MASYTEGSRPREAPRRGNERVLLPTPPSQPAHPYSSWPPPPRCRRLRRRRKRGRPPADRRRDPAVAIAAGTGVVVGHAVWASPSNSTINALPSAGSSSARAAWARQLRLGQHSAVVELERDAGPVDRQCLDQRPVGRLTVDPVWSTSHGPELPGAQAAGTGWCSPPTARSSRTTT